MTLKIEKEIKELEKLRNTNLNFEELLNKKVLNEEEIEELLNTALIDLTLNFCISKLKGEVSNDLLYQASSLKELIKKLRKLKKTIKGIFHSLFVDKIKPNCHNSNY